LYGEERPVPREQEIAEEYRRIRRLRFLVDFSLQLIMQVDLSRDEAIGIVEDVKRHACRLFPGKEETFELIYRPRFMRIIDDKYGTSAMTADRA
jgi:hypothetical protein